MSSIKQFTKPHLIRGSLENGKVEELEQIKFSKKEKTDNSHLYDEKWIQNLIFNHPKLLPVKEIEPTFSPIYSVCRELNTPAGPLDNLFVSKNGGLVLVECKLWRNPEARREVIGQALDYAKEFSRWSYKDLVNAVKISTKSTVDGIQEAVRKNINYSDDASDDFDEATFIDAVSRNLKRGRFLVLIVGDGIRESVEDITSFLQRHTSLDFTFGLVELAVYQVRGEEEYVVQPRILANSCTIERAVIRIDAQGAITVEQPVEELSSGATRTGKRTTISEEIFYEELAGNTDQQTANELKQFMDRLSEREITPSFGSSSLNLRSFPGGTKKMNFGSIRKNGTVDTDPANWATGQLNRPDIGERYQETLAAIASGKVLETKNGNGFNLRVVRGDGSMVTLGDLLKVKDRWFDLIVSTQDELDKVARDIENE